VSEARRGWSLPAFALVALAVIGALGLAAVLWSRGDAAPDPSVEPASPAVEQDGLSASADFRPRIALFGDTIDAWVDVVADPSVVDPTTVQVTWDSAPWTPVVPPRTAIEQVGSTAHVRVTYVLRCLSGVCAPARETERLDLEPARVSYTTTAGGRRSQETADVTWPTLVVHTRVAGVDGAARDALSAPWRADLASLPAVSYRVPPWLAVALLATLGVALVALAGVAVYRVWPRREPEPEPEPEPEHVASVLEQALELLEADVSDDGVEERRRALELVADEVEHLGDESLADSARELAWSPVDPAVERTRALAADLRVRFADVLAELEVERANGDLVAGRANGGSP
jgi:hypothetical protein